jgi:hypothetical protein
MPDDRHLDTLIDQALSTYVDAEPDPSLGARITARVACTTSRPWMWLLGAAVACAAGVLLAALLLPTTRAPFLPPTAERSVASAPERSAPAVVAPRPAVARHVRPSTPRLHRNRPPALLRSPAVPRESFLSTEEKMLVNFASQHPEQARQILSFGEKDRTPLQADALSIPPISIAALTPSELQKSDNPNR